MKGIPQKQVPTGIKYYAVIYLYNDTIHAIPYDSQEEAEGALKTWIAKVKKELGNDPKKTKGKTTPDEYVKNFYVVKRNMDKYANGEVF